MDALIPADVLSDEPFGDAELDEWLDVLAAAEPDEDPTPEPGEETNPAQRWTVTDTGDAEWAMAKLAALRNIIDANNQQAAEWEQRIRDWREHENRRATQRATHFEALLADYALNRREDTNGKVKTVIVPSGSVKTTSSAAAVIVDDEDAVLAWLDDHPTIAAEAVKRSVLVSKLRPYAKIVDPTDPTSKIVTDTGEVIPGAILRPASVSATITTGGTQ